MKMRVSVGAGLIAMAIGSMVHSVGSAGKQKGNSEIQDANQTRAGLLRLLDRDMARVSTGVKAPLRRA